LALVSFAFPQRWPLIIVAKNDGRERLIIIARDDGGTIDSRHVRLVVLDVALRTARDVGPMKIRNWLFCEEF
jgi:hypothetical protein